MLPSFTGVDVDQRARVLVLVAADRLTGADVDVREPVEPAPDQHGVDRRGRGARLRADRQRRQSLLPSQVHDPADQVRRCAVGAAVRARGAVFYARQAHLGVADRPPLGGRPGHVEVLGGPGDGPPVLDDQTPELGLDGPWGSGPH
ncbi:hypothetical protein GCM10009756_00540 [Pseudokineococcus marinus]